MNDEKVTKINGITEGVIWKQLLLFFFPILLGSLFQQFYNAVDAIVVGRFVGKEALSSVGGSTGTLINLLIGFFLGLSAGSSVCISQYYGARKEQEVADSVHTAMAMAIVGGAVLMVVGLLFTNQALIWMGVPEEIFNYSRQYMLIYFAGIIPNLVYNMGAGILRAVGDSRRPLYYLIVSCLLNIVLDLVFVVGLHLEIIGVAVATVISQLVSAILVCAALMRSKECYHLSWKMVRFHKYHLHKMIKIGLPGGFQSVMYTLSNIIIQAQINSFGTDTIAAWTVYGKIDAFFWVTVAAFGTAITTFNGQNYGAGKMSRVRKATRQCMAMTFGATVLLSLVLYYGASPIYRVFTSDGDVITIGLDMMHYLVPVYVTYISVEVLSGALRGMGNVIVPTIMTLVGVCGLRLLWLFTVVPVHHELHTLMFSYPLTWVVASLGFIFYYGHVKRKMPKEEKEQ